MFEQNIALGPGTEVFSSHLTEIVIMLLGAALLGFIIGWLFRKTYKDVYLAMKAEHDLCPGIKAGLEQTISDLEVKLVDCRAELERAKAMITGLTHEKEELQANLNSKISDLETATASIASLGQENKTLKTTLDNCNASITALEGEKARLNSVIISHKEEIASLGLKLAAFAPVPDMKEAAHVFGKKYAVNDLKLVEGIGPKIEELFHKAGITTWGQLAASEAGKLKTILDSGGDQFQMHDPSTWPRQAELAAQGLWKELKELQDKLQGGKG